ncbi:MAG: hypothetical protein ACP5R5_14390, partial [Armatimonadota bacterium]
GELYFIRRTIGAGQALNFTISGSQYRAMIGAAGNLIQIEGKSSVSARDRIRIANLSGAAQTVEVETFGSERSLSIKQLRADVKTNDWRSIEVKDLRAARNVPVAIQAVGDLESVVVSSENQPASFELDLQQRIKGRFSTRKTERLTTTPGKLLRVAPRDWGALDRTEIGKETLDRSALQIRALKTATPLITRGVPAVTPEPSTVTPEPPKISPATAVAGEFSPLTDLEFKVESAVITDAELRGRRPPDGYQYVVLALTARNPRSGEVRFTDSDYVAHLFNAAGEEIRWNGVFLGERGDTGMTVMDVGPGGTVGLRVYFTVPTGTALGKFTLAARSTGRSLTVDLSGQ